MDLCHAVGDARKYWRISEETLAILVRALEALANVQEGCVGTSGLVSGGVTAVSPVVTSVAGRNNCGCLDDLFYLCTGVADALGNSIVLAKPVVRRCVFGSF
jgi:hypothetical protein